jgi:hypothetical protein
MSSMADIDIKIEKCNQELHEIRNACYLMLQELKQLKKGDFH